MLTAQVDPTETSLLVTEPYFNLPNIAETYDQMIFEEWEFDSYFRCTRKQILQFHAHDSAAALIPYGGLFGDTSPPPQCLVAVDIGYSFSHVVPVKDGEVLWDQVKRYAFLLNYAIQLMAQDRHRRETFNKPPETPHFVSTMEYDRPDICRQCCQRSLRIRLNGLEGGRRSGQVSISLAHSLTPGANHGKILSCRNMSYRTFRPLQRPELAISAQDPMPLPQHQSTVIPRQRKSLKRGKKSKCCSWATNVLLGQNCYSAHLI